jgi:uncharacterized membrane protein YjgN (DUF898 family)
MNIALSISALTSHIRLSERTAVTFAGAPGAFAGLLVQGSVLQIATAGFYRFWLITDIRRHLWGNTRVGRETLEYTGTGRELLIGYMIALAVLAPIYATYFVLGIAAEKLQAFASVPLSLIVYAFGHYAAFRARRYRATRTAFRGVRFWMTGSAWAYAGKAILWDLATILSLGLALPWRMAAVERYKLQNTHFGDLRGDFVGSGGALFRRGIALWGSAVGVPLVGVLLALLLGRNKAILPAVLGSTAVLTMAVLPIAFFIFRGAAIRWLVEGVRFGEVSLESTLRLPTVLACYLTWIGATALYATVFGSVAWSAVMTWIEGWQEIGENWMRHAVDGAGLLAFYLVFLLGLGVLKRFFVDRGLWVAVAFTTAVVNLAAADRVTAAGEPAGSLGEGLADALDVGAIL